MPLKDTVNSLVQRTTGYRLTKETEQQRQEAIAEAVRKAKSPVEAPQDWQRPAHQPPKNRSGDGTSPSHKAAGGVFAGYDDELRRIVERVKPRTMTRTPKLTALIEAVRFVEEHQVPGEVVECGVWRGGSMQAVALTLLSLGSTERELHLFDTFEGMPAPTEEDERTTAQGTVSAEELLATSSKESKMWAVAGLDDVQEAMAETEYPADKVHFHQGLVEDTTPGEAPETIAILRLDTDWYASTKHELEVLYDRLSPGGILIIDDYGSWEGARKATDEWLRKTREPLFLAPMGAGRIAVKPLRDR